MAFRRTPHSLLAAAFTVVAATLSIAPVLHAQVFVVGEKTAMADVSTEFHPTKIELSSKPINELGRRELVRDLEAESGFAHRVLPVADTVTLVANGKLYPSGDDYKELIYKKGQSASPGDRVAITTVTVKPDAILLDINGGPYLKHRILRHIDINGMALAPNNGEQVTGFRIELVFEGGVPDISAPEVKALLDPLIDFGVKSGGQAYADTLPPFLKQAITQHDVLVGMDRKMVLAAMGAPESKVRELVPGSEDKHYEEWIYGKVPQTVRFVRIVGDRVTQVRIAELGQPIAVHTENEMQGYLDPQDEHEIAMGDSVGSHDEEAHTRSAPTILKPGEVGAGGVLKVQMPASTQSKSSSSTPPATPADPPATAPMASTP